MADALGGVLSCFDGPAAEGSEIEPVTNPYYARASAKAGVDASASAALYANLASVHVLRGDVAAARLCTRQALSLEPGCRAALVALVYLDLREGRTDEAIELLHKQRLPADAA